MSGESKETPTKREEMVLHDEPEENKKRTKGRMNANTLNGNGRELKENWGIAPSSGGR